MAQTITTAAVSRVNRRFLLLAIILAILSAVLVYAQMSRSGSTATGSAGNVSVVVARGVTGVQDVKLRIAELPVATPFPG